MNYIGSKLSLLEFLEKSITEIVGNDTNKVFCDLFAGTGAVGTHFKKKGYKIIANDLQYYSYVLNRHYVGNHQKLEFTGLNTIIPELEDCDNKSSVVCNYLEQSQGLEGFVYKNYCPSNKNDTNRMYFTVENGKKCDAIREKIEEWYQNSLINDDEYYYLLATLIEAIDSVANTASVYGAYLKEFKKSAQKELVFTPLSLYVNDNEHNVYNKDASELVEEIEPDILYLDPPYNARQYSANYHVLETIAKYDNPAIKGKTGLRDWSSQKSKYCSRTTVKNEFANLIQKANAKYIFLSYNNEGLLSLDDIKESMSKKGEYGVFMQEYNRFKADKTENRNHKADKTTEYLHYVICE